jgi:hypothetical protein
VSDPNLSPSFDETGHVDELPLRRNRNRSEPEYSTEDDLGIENDLSPDDDDFDTLGLSPYDDYDDAAIIDDPDVEPRLVTDEDEDEDEDDDELIYDDDER